MSKIRLYQGRPGDTVGVAVVAASITRTIDAFTVCNDSGGAVTLTVHIVPSGDTPVSANKLYHEKSIAAGETIKLDALINQPIERGDTLQMVASTADAVTVTIGGRQQ